MTTTSTFAPTPEQEQALALFASGENLVIEAGAGTGKTSTLKLLAESTSRQGQYIAFNKAIVTEAGAKFPGNVTCSTAHSLAFRAVGKRYKHRLNSGRMKSQEIARHLGIDPLTIQVGQARKALAPGFLAGHVMKAVGSFCQSADPEPTERHVPYVDGIDVPTADGRRTWANNDLLREHLIRFVRAAWVDLQRENGVFPYKHDHYLKAFQLGKPRIGADFILFDEAQDANPVMAAIVAAQTHAQLVYVGDSQQQIYEFTGAVNALGKLDGQRTFLTQSFRFGPEVAKVANRVLEDLDAELRIEGTETIASVVAPIAEPDAVLCRTNAAAVERVLEALKAGRRPHLVGGGYEVVDFAKAARDLMTQGRTYHPELACFDSWGEVQEYVERDPQGGELRLLVKLVDDFGVDVILDALDRMTPEDRADVIVSTAHKSKGREWDSVALAADFNPKGDRGLEDGELRLLYVAVTRARRELDVTMVDHFRDEEDSPVEVTADAPFVAGLEGAEATAAGGCPRCARTDVVDATSGRVHAHRCHA